MKSSRLAWLLVYGKPCGHMTNHMWALLHRSKNSSTKDVFGLQKRTDTRRGEHKELYAQCIWIPSTMARLLQCGWCHVCEAVKSTKVPRREVLIGHHCSGLWEDLVACPAPSPGQFSPKPASKIRFNEKSCKFIPKMCAVSERGHSNIWRYILSQNRDLAQREVVEKRNKNRCNSKAEFLQLVVCSMHINTS